MDIFLSLRGKLYNPDILITDTKNEIVTYNLWALISYTGIKKVIALITYFKRVIALIAYRQVTVITYKPQGANTTTLTF